MSTPKTPPKPTAKNPPRPPAKKKTISTGAMLGIVLGVVVVLAAIVALALSLTSNGKDSAASGDVQYRPVKVVSGSALPAGTGADDPAVGQPAPGLDGQSFDGTPVVIKPGDGQPMLVIFGAHWCPHCQKELPHIQGLVDAGRMPEGLEIVAVSTGVQPAANNYPPSAWFDRIGWSNPVMADDEASSAARAYGLQSYPLLVAVDPSGVVKGRVSGELTDEQLSSFLQDTLGQQLG